MVFRQDEPPNCLRSLAKKRQKPTSMFARIKCSLGQHQWSAWETDVTVKCRLIRHCEICHTTDIGEAHHQFGDWARAIRNDRCVEVRTCPICHQMETRLADHRWSDWGYEGQASCQQRRLCLDCGYMETQPPQHLWGDWQAVEGEAKKLQRTCQRCGTAEYKQGAIRRDRSIMQEETELPLPLRHEAEAAESILADIPAPDAVKSAILNESADHALEVSIMDGDADPDIIENSAAQMVEEPVQQVETAKAKKPRKRKSKAVPPHTATGTEPQHAHTWGEWHYSEENPCLFVRVCETCGQQEDDPAQALHEFAWIQAQTPEPICLWKHQCTRCGHIETTENRHQYIWAAQAEAPCTREFRCEHCGQVAETQTAHSWFLTMRTDRGTEHYTCEVCHKTMVR